MENAQGTRESGAMAFRQRESVMREANIFEILSGSLRILGSGDMDRREWRPL